MLPARGHILTLEEPDDVRDTWKTWSAELLWPGQFYAKKPIPDTMSYLEAIRTAARDADRVIVATDCDREGQLIGGEIVDYIEFRGEVLRCIFNAEDPTTLRQAFERLRPNQEFHGLYMSGQAREQADQISNLSLTRTATVTLKAPGTKGAIGIGRVKTPVLAIVCKRELEILNFKPQDMFEVDATVKVGAGELLLTCAKLPRTLVAEEGGKLEEGEELSPEEAALAEKESMVGRILKRQIADDLAAAVRVQVAPVGAKSETKTQGPPRLFDLTALQAAASARWGWTGERTLDVAQKLYSERTLITYPRGEAKHLPEAGIADIPQLVPALLGLPRYGQHAALLAEPVVRRGKTGHFSDKALEGLSHYAIIPNVNMASQFASAVSRLTEDEARLFDMIARQYLAALAPDHQYRQTTIEMLLPWKGHDWSFRTSGRIPLVPGWKAILGGAASADEGIELPAVRDREPGEVLKAVVRTVTTRPPARYTEGSLIRVMQEAWRLVDDPELRARLKEAKGIGTPATRGNILKGLFTQGQLAAKGKQILPTEGGLKLYQTLGEVCPNVVDPVRTARWETLFDSVEKGHMEAEEAVRKILAGVNKEIERIVARAGSVQIQIGRAQKPTSKMLAVAKAISERKGIPLPRGCLSDSSVCRKFLDEHLPKRESGEGGAGGSYAPSEKQLAFASRLAEETGTELTAAAKVSTKSLSAWIDDVQAKAGPRRPSDKQLAFAKTLSEEKGEELPAEAQRDAKACSAFIDRMMGGGSGAGKGRTSAKASAPGVKGEGRVVPPKGAVARRPRQSRSRLQG